MDWKLIGSTFGLVFLAEMGDRTQLATMFLASGATSRWSVFLGSALALVATSAIAVLAGDIVTRYVPPVWLKRVAGAAFVVLGIIFLLARGEQQST